ncbi:MAG: hypothetical protein Q4C70_15425, partial [Planctomycetia bacterium]|nr:hypothetical protein [Planctomycetia bacterium]
MMDNHNSKFNPYHKFLGIPVDCTSPNYYVLLGISLFENDVEVISNTADGRTMFLRSMQTGKYAEYIHRLLNEVAKARVCLLNPAQKREYDQQLRNEQTSQASELQISSSAIAPVLPPKSTVHKSSEPPVTSAPRVPEPPVTSAPRVPESSVKSVAPVLPSVTSSPLDSISDVKSQTVDHNSEDEETLLFLSAIEQETP